MLESARYENERAALREESAVKLMAAEVLAGILAGDIAKGDLFHEEGGPRAGFMGAANSRYKALTGEYPDAYMGAVATVVGEFLDNDDIRVMAEAMAAVYGGVN